ncbi:forkhead box protein N4 [Galendromus occidentalis]|uniref:Forkhead box protein N4 n=1 Tax=Galendromus occidentalis TaxID=34638 RepID=A0AAJ6QS07_9ACAR|nr:forkhead box protein N4 [Galendromus occidentalis]
MMDLYYPCLLPDMIESDLQTDLGCGVELGSSNLPPLEGMGALDTLDPAWLTDSQGPLHNDLDSLDVGLMVNPQTGLPSLTFSASLAAAASNSVSEAPNSLSNSISSDVIHSTKKSVGSFNLLAGTSTTHNSSQSSLSIGNSASAATPIVATTALGGLIHNQGTIAPQPLTASNVQALLGQSNSTGQHSQPAAKKSRLNDHPDHESSSAPEPAATSTDGVKSAFPKPAYSYSCLIAMALKNSKTGSLPVNEIYNFMIENFPYFKTAPNGWKNSVRHNLSLNKCFEKIEKPTTGPNGSQRKGCLWAMNPSKVGKMDEEVQKWSKKDPANIRRSMAQPDRLELLEKGFLKDLYTELDGAEDEEEEEVEDTVSSVEEDIEAMLPDTPPTSQDENAVKVKVMDSALDKVSFQIYN